MNWKLTILLLIIILLGCQTIKNINEKADPSNNTNIFLNSKLNTPPIDVVFNPSSIKDTKVDRLDNDIDDNVDIEYSKDANINLDQNKKQQYTQKEKFKQSNEPKKRYQSSKNNDEKEHEDYFVYRDKESMHEIESNANSINKNKKNLEEKKSTLIKKEIEDKSFNFTNIENVKIKELELKEIEIEENQQIFISIRLSGWIIKSIKPQLLKLIKRENSEKNTLFQFNAGVSSIVNIIFLRYDSYNNVICRQPYRVKIMPKTWVEIDKEKEKKQKEEIRSTKNERESDKENFSKVIANQFFGQKKHEEAKERYLLLIKEGKGDPEIYYKMGIIEKQNLNDQKSYEYFKLALKEKENLFYIDALIELIKYLKNHKKYLEAVDAFFKYGFNENLSTKSAEELYILLSDVYFNMKDFKNAAKEYRRFIQRFPESRYYDKALFYLAYSIENFEQDPDFKEAYRLYKIILTQHPESKYNNLSKNRMLYLKRHYLKIN